MELNELGGAELEVQVPVREPVAQVLEVLAHVLVNGAEPMVLAHCGEHLVDAEPRQVHDGLPRLPLLEEVEEPKRRVERLNTVQAAQADHVQDGERRVFDAAELLLDEAVQVVAEDVLLEVLLSQRVRDVGCVVLPDAGEGLDENLLGEHHDWGDRTDAVALQDVQQLLVVPERLVEGWHGVGLRGAHAITFFLY